MLVSFIIRIITVSFVLMNYQAKKGHPAKEVNDIH